MTSLRPDVALDSIKRDLMYMRECLNQSIESCDALEQGPLLQVKRELSDARQRIVELENENSSLKLLLNRGGGSYRENGITESLQIQIDQQLLKTKYENEKLQEKIKTLDEEILCLKQQVSIFKDDFEMERKDRENAQSQIADLKKQLNYLISTGNRRFDDPPPVRPHHHNEPRYYGYDVCDSGVPQTPNSISCKTKMNNGNNFIGQDNNIAARRYLGSDNLGHDVCDVHEARYESDGLSLNGRGVSPMSRFNVDIAGGDWNAAKTPVQSSDQLSEMSGIRTKTNTYSPTMPRYNSIITGNTLSCPNCRKKFSTEDHMLLLEHLEICN